RPSVQDPADEPRAGVARADFQECADTVLVGMFDHRGEIDEVSRLRGDGLGRCAAVHRIGAAPDTAVEHDSRERARLPIVQVAIFRLDYAANLAVQRTDRGKLKERAAEFLYDLLDGPSETTDDGLIPGVADQGVNTSSGGNRRMDRLQGGGDNPGDPINRLV